MDDAQRLLEFHIEQPPAPILLNILLRSFTNWKPSVERPANNSKPTQHEAMAIASLPTRTLDCAPLEVQGWWAEMTKGKAKVMEPYA